MIERPMVPPMLRRAASVVILTCGLSWPAAGQSAAPAPATPDKPTAPTAAQKYLNIQVLKDLPAEQLHDVMVYMNASLGTKCEACHVRGADGEMAFEKDDKRNKATTRKMIEMVEAINARDFNGQQQVTCTTCHQGRLSPSSIPQLAQPLPAGQSAAPPPAGPPGTRPKPPAEAADQVITKFVDALGGREALAAIAARTRKGTVTNREGRTAPVVIDEKAPGRYRESVAGAPGFDEGFDANGAWLQEGDRVRDLKGIEALPPAGADLSLPLDLSRYSALASRAYDTIDGHNVIVLTGRSSPDVTETLSFDRTSGLLLRRVARIRTAMGRLPVQVDYGDYRAVGAVKMPFDVRVSDWSSLSILKFAEITLNPPLDEARFAKPATRPASE